MICRHCFNENVEGADICAFCGESLLLVVEQQAVGTIYCTQCGTENREDALSCISCRHMLAEVPEVPPDYRPAPPRPETGESEFPPRTLIDIIGESLSLYRRHLGPFVLIALCSFFGALAAFSVSSLYVLITSLAALVLFGAWGWGATVEAVSQHYLLGRVRVVACYSRVMTRWFSLTLAFLVMSVPTWIGPFILLQTDWYVAGLALFPIACYVMVRWFFFAGPLLVENRQPMASLGRSSELVGKDGWRVFGIGVVFFLVWTGASLVLSIPGILVDSFSQRAGSLLLVLAVVLTLPIMWIGSTLVYFDLRQRREGFDMAKLASELGYEVKK